MAGIDRRKVNKQSVSAADPLRSGFDLGYTSYSDYTLGFVHVGGVHWQMPGSKFSGHNIGNFTFNNVSTPMVSPIDATQYNVVVSLRSIDRSFEDAFAPSKNNAMSANWRVPTWQLNERVVEWISGMEGSASIYSVLSQTASPAITQQMINVIQRIPSQLSLHRSYDDFSHHYLLDFFDDIAEYMTARLAGLTAGMPMADAREIILDALITPLFGEGSLIDELGFIKVRKYDINLLSQVGNISDDDALLSLIDSTPQSEYPLRAYYAAWYELMREPNLEPVSTTLPKWKDFGSSSVCNLPFFAHRYRAWYDDMYTTSQPDDMSRHVYAPIFATITQGSVSDNSDNIVDYPAEISDYQNAEPYVGMAVNQHNLVSQRLTWRDPLTGNQRFLDCPLPGLVHDSLRGDITGSTVYGLDLLNLRQAQSLERYLKRNFYFGDEYKDRMLAHYGSEVSDHRLNRPTLISTSINAKEEDQEIANVSTERTNVGDRTATMTVKTSGDGYEYFAEEFSIVLNYVSFMPRPQYAGVLPHNLLYRQMDFPQPEFAANNEELSRVAEIAVSGLTKTVDLKRTFGHHPYAHIWRSRVDEVHGSFLSARRDYTFARFFGAKDINTLPVLNYRFIHCRPSLGMFTNQVRLDGQLYGSIIHEFYSECPLPVPVENI